MTAEGAAGPGADEQDDTPPTRAPYEVVDARDLAVLARASWPGRADPGAAPEPRRPEPPAGSKLPSDDPLAHLRGETAPRRMPGAGLRERAGRIPLTTWLVAAGAALAVTVVALVPVQMPAARARQVVDTEEVPESRPVRRSTTTTTARRSAVTTYLPASTTTVAPPPPSAPTPTAASPRPTTAPAPARAATPTTSRRTATTSAPRRTTTTRRPAPATTQAPPPPSEDPGSDEPPPYP